MFGRYGRKGDDMFFGLRWVFAARSDSQRAVRSMEQAKKVRYAVLLSTFLGGGGLLLLLDISWGQPFTDDGIARSWLLGVLSGLVAQLLLANGIDWLMFRMYLATEEIIRVEEAVMLARHPNPTIWRIFWPRVKPELRFELQMAYRSSVEDFEAMLLYYDLWYPGKK